MTTVRFPAAIISIFLWIGFVSAISFMEALLKFQAPGITLAHGLSIGRLIFQALNRIEWVLLISLIIHVFLFINFRNKTHLIFISLLTIILSFQTFWLLPALDVRAESIIQGIEVPPSKLHIIFVILEIIKVATLFTFGIKQFSHHKK